MSFNRGEYLKNCVSSIERHVPHSRIAIFDDSSNDPSTRLFLEELKKKYDVSGFQNRSSSHLGGLYSNMNLAIEYALKKNAKFLFLIQDDQQIVRDFDSRFLNECLEIFESDESICQILPIFFKGFIPDSLYKKKYEIHRNPDFYRDPAYGIADVGLVHLERIERKQFRFQSSEHQSARSALEAGFKLVHSKNPVFMFTPWPSVHRNISNPVVRFVAHLNQLGVKAGCHPFKPMQHDKIQSLVSRPVEEFPRAEDFLTTYSSLKKPWWFSDPFNIEKIKKIHHLLKLDWIFNATSEYIELCEKQNKVSSPE